MPPAGAPAAMLAVDLDLIHRCLGHACEAMCHTHVGHSEVYCDAQKAHLHSSHLSQPCHVCALGKQVASPHQKAPTLPEEHSERPSKIISTNLLTVEVPSIGVACYVLAVTDVSTHYHWTAPLRLKSDSTDKLCHIILSMPETHCPLTLRTDGGGEFFNARLDLWFNKLGILHPPAPPYTSEYNGLRALSVHFNGPCEVLPYRRWTTRQVLGRSLCSCNLPSQHHSYLGQH